MTGSQPLAFRRQTIMKIAEAVEEAEWQRFRASGESLTSGEIADLIERGLAAEHSSNGSFQALAAVAPNGD